MKGSILLATRSSPCSWPLEECLLWAYWCLLLSKSIWTSPSPSSSPSFSPSHVDLCSSVMFCPEGDEWLTWVFMPLPCSHSMILCVPMPGCWISHRPSSTWGSWLVHSSWAMLQTGTVWALLSFGLLGGEITSSITCNRHVSTFCRFNYLWINTPKLC